jgi:hypothetical protein
MDGEHTNLRSGDNAPNRRIASDTSLGLAVADAEPVTLTADHGRTHIWIGELIDRQAEFVEAIRISNEEPPLVLSPLSRSARHARNCVVPARHNPFAHPR